MLVKPPFPRLQRGNPLAYGLVGAWEFYEGAGPIVHDVSGNRNHGTIANAAPWVGSKIGWALSLNGSSQNVPIGPTPAALQGGAGTGRGFYFRAFVRSTAQQILLDTGQNGSVVYIGAGPYLEYAVGNIANTGQSAATTGFTTNAWHDFLVTVTVGSSVQFYIDGVLRNSKSFTSTGSSYTYGITIGSNSHDYGGGLVYANCIIGPVITWGRVVSPKEITKPGSN